jgi:hypothetical protein
MYSNFYFKPSRILAAYFAYLKRAVIREYSKRNSPR